MKRFSIALVLASVVWSKITFAEQYFTGFGLSEPNYLISGFNSSSHNAPLSTEGNNRMKLRIGVYYRVLAFKEDRSGLYLSYNQNSFWKRADPGTPFLDNNYRPELSACLDILRWITGNEDLYIPKIKAFVSRESNWAKGSDYRGYDKIGGFLEIGQFGKTEYYASFGCWKDLNVSSNNKDIRNYAGDAQIRIGYWYFNTNRIVKWGTSLDLRFNLDNSDITSVATSVYFNPLAGKNWKWTPALMVEYYYGTAECLLYYKAKTNSIRVGIAFM
ncbi:MAG TPA: phospholipase A [Chitinispirillaceae bacterium]|nr:phospholipase A [Chitinispirillaceae bacterium]